MSIRVDPREHYRHCSDDELQRLAEGYDQLMPEAQRALLTTTLVYKVPHCRSGAGEIKGSAIWFILAYLAAMAIVGVLVGVWLDWRAGGASAILLMLLSWNKLKKLRLNSPGGIFILDFDDASTSFAVKDRVYADRFGRLNQQLDSKDGVPAA
jgi:hypothetical protein